MKQKQENRPRKIASILKGLFGIFFIILFLIIPMISEEAGLFILKWLKFIPPIIGSIALILLAVSWIMPGIFVVLGKPQLAHKWLRRINPVVISATPWGQLSGRQKLFTYIWSLTISGFTLFAVIAVILYALEK